MYYFLYPHVIRAERNKEGYVTYGLIRKEQQSKVEIVDPKLYLKGKLTNPDIVVEEPLKETELCKIRGYGDYVFTIKSIRSDYVILSLVFPLIKINLLSLSEEDCELLGLEYSEKLFRISKSIDLDRFRSPEEEKRKGLLSQNIIQERYVIIKLQGFLMVDKKYLITPSKARIEVELFLVSLKVTLKDNINSLSTKHASWNKGDEVEWSIIHSYKSGESICDSKGNIYLKLDLSRDGKNINPISLQVLASNLFQVSWDESFNFETHNLTPEVRKFKDIRYINNIFTKKGEEYYRKRNTELVAKEIR